MEITLKDIYSAVAWQEVYLWFLSVVVMAMLVLQVAIIARLWNKK